MPIQNGVGYGQATAIEVFMSAEGPRPSSPVQREVVLMG